MKLGGKLINIIGIYAPENNEEENTQEFFDDLLTTKTTCRRVSDYSVRL